MRSTAVHVSSLECLEGTSNICKGLMMQSSSLLSTRSSNVNESVLHDKFILEWLLSIVAWSSLKLLRVRAWISSPELWWRLLTALRWLTCLLHQDPWNHLHADGSQCTHYLAPVSPILLSSISHDPGTLRFLNFKSQASVLTSHFFFYTHETKSLNSTT